MTGDLRRHEFMWRHCNALFEIFYIWHKGGRYRDPKRYWFCLGCVDFGTTNNLNPIMFMLGEMWYIYCAKLEWIVCHIRFPTILIDNTRQVTPDNKVHGANMGPIWVLSAPDGPHVGFMIHAIRDNISQS